MENLNPIKLFINRIYYFLFVERFNKKLLFNFPEKVFRWDLIQFLIDKYKYSTYLEIGCDKDQSFSKIKIPHKLLMNYTDLNLLKHLFLCKFYFYSGHILYLLL